MPIVVVDEELYRVLPSLLVATVDKFAQIPFKGEASALFGARDRYSPIYGHLCEAHGREVGGRVVRDARNASALVPPELIIQDELHLISGPLGTMVGLYESIIDRATSIIPSSGGPVIPAKIIASTATIRRADRQVQSLYNRELRVFPQPGIDASDSFFAHEHQVDPGKDDSSGRLYLGLCAPGMSAKMLLVRTYAVLLATAQRALDVHGSDADPYMTLVGYFNSLRALGGTLRLVEDNVNLNRLKYLHEQRKYPRRYVDKIEEMTSRAGASKIPGLLTALERSFQQERRGGPHPVDVLLATNMISVGVDIDRLGLMVVVGQPKSTSEYIQATSRVGRKHPGLVVVVYNWPAPRDISHYEHFIAYHQSMYRHVEAVSATPFSLRAIDRGLNGLLAGLVRATVPEMARERDAENFRIENDAVRSIVEYLVTRANAVNGPRAAEYLRREADERLKKWEEVTHEPLRYCWHDPYNVPPANERVLLRFTGTSKMAYWDAPGSLRGVESTAAFYVAIERQAMRNGYKQPTGDVRPSQILTAFGPGAMVDLTHTTVVVASIEQWVGGEDGHNLVKYDSRLGAALKVTAFYAPPASERDGGSPQGTIGTFIFPEYQQCSRCNTLSRFGDGDTTYVPGKEWIECTVPGCLPTGGRRARTYPAPFVIACSGGHLDDFPWRRYVHEEGGDFECRKRLRLVRSGLLGTVGDMRVVCECGAERSMADAFAKRVVECTNRRPWLDMHNRTTNPGRCLRKARIVQRGASNVWFPVVRSVLRIGSEETGIDAALQQCDAQQLEKLTSLEDLKNVLKIGFFSPLAEFAADQVWTALQQRNQRHTDLISMDLRLPEWQVLTASDGSRSDNVDNDLLFEAVDVPASFAETLVRVLLLHRLQEVRALIGFTRIDPDTGFDDTIPKEIVHIRRQSTTWLPAIEVRGEGIFLQFNEQHITEWEQRPEVVERMEAMRRRLNDWADERSISAPTFPGARYVLLHTLAHAMIRQLALDSGYSAGAIRERLYCSGDPHNPMAGVLLYTAANDSDGSLGGLVELGMSDRLPVLLRQSLRSATICSSDPICSDMTPDLHSSINGAACHSCMLISETSCERSNQFLDRNLLVKTLHSKGTEFFERY